ncbi:MAG TPA: CcmD family protein [Flavobacteriales bacterium]|nr:CcmD family protein [Flavobacteriales bacterium]HIN39193.1 CcmD family protein [Flavobacteriales bacterium]
MFDSALLFAQDTIELSSQNIGERIEMADSMRESGKIYVVVAVLSVIFLGLSVFLFTLDRRIRIIEESQRQEK